MASNWRADLPSLASSTGTRVDSAAKHTLQCKVAEPLIREWAKLATNGGDADRHIEQNKMVYCVHKNELAMNVATALMPNSNVSLVQTFRQNHAYPPIVSTVGCMKPKAQEKVRGLYSALTFVAFRGYLNTLEREQKDVHDAMKADGVKPHPDDQEVNSAVLNLPYFMPMGYALTFGHPHHMLGDTVCTLLIGGMITVRNGAFEMRTGQLVQWYFDFEDECFAASADGHHAAGERLYFGGAKPAKPNALTYPQGEADPQYITDMKKYNDRASITNDHIRDDRYSRASWGDREYAATSNGKRKRYDNPTGDKARMVFRIKPYVKSSNPMAPGGDVYGDKIRVFAKCIGGGRAFDDVDIMLMTQSM